MKRFIPRDKLSKKNRKALDSRERRGWDNINPATKKIESKKLYNRKKAQFRIDEFQTGPFFISSVKRPLSLLNKGSSALAPSASAAVLAFFSFCLKSLFSRIPALSS